MKSTLLIISIAFLAGFSTVQAGTLHWFDSNIEVPEEEEIQADIWDLPSLEASPLDNGGKWQFFRWFEKTMVPTPSGESEPFTFTIDPGFTGKLEIVDVGNTGDRFELFDFGSTLGLTSAPVSPYDPNVTGPDPDANFADTQWSKGTFFLGSGTHSITITLAENNPDLNHGGGYLRLMVIPEPSAGLLLAAAGLLWFRRRSR